jgi:uncharacterized protein GlcG (DUF336 family)
MGLAAFLLAASVSAAPTPVAPARGVIVTHSLSVQMAQTIVSAAVEACRKMGYRTTISVVDASGMLKAFARDDGTAPHTIELSKAKAYTAVTLANRFATSGEFATARNSTLGSPMSNIEGVVAIGGGVPIKYHDEVIGGVGSSGAIGGDKDELCAKAGIAAVSDDLQ